jgi:hypothetical protein
MRSIPLQNHDVLYSLSLFPSSVTRRPPTCSCSRCACPDVHHVVSVTHVAVAMSYLPCRVTHAPNSVSDFLGAPDPLSPTFDDDPISCSRNATRLSNWVTRSLLPFKLVCGPLLCRFGCSCISCISNFFAGYGPDILKGCRNSYLCFLQLSILFLWPAQRLSLQVPRAL